MKRCLICAVLILSFSGSAGAQKSKLDLTQRFLLLATTKTGTLQKELSEAAAAGYRIICASPSFGGENMVILEKVATSPNTYEYQLLGTTSIKTMEREISEIAEKGFRLVPQSIHARKQTLGLLPGQEIVLIMEKPPGSSTQYKYLLLGTQRTSTMQKEMSQAADEGYKAVGIVLFGENHVILEKPVGNP